MDLTKYIEEHNFNFDNVFDEGADNRQVRKPKSLLYLDISDMCAAPDRVHLPRC